MASSVRWLDLGLIQIVLGLAAALGIVAPVPGLQRAIDAVLVQHVGEALRVLIGAGLGMGPDFGQQRLDIGGIAGHFWLKLVAGEIGITRLRTFMAQAQDFSQQIRKRNKPRIVRGKTITDSHSGTP